MAITGPGEQFHVPHIRAFDSELAQAVGETIGLADERMRAIKEKVVFIAKVKADREKKLEYVASLFQPKLLEKEKLSHLDLKQWPFKVFNAIDNSPGSSIMVGRNPVASTWYGVWNGVTYAVDHLRGKSRDAAMTGAWFGAEASLKRKALDLAVTYAKAA